MSAEAMDAHFAETGAKLMRPTRDRLAGKSLQYFHVDSWELGPAHLDARRCARSFSGGGATIRCLWLPAVAGPDGWTAAQPKPERFLAGLSPHGRGPGGGAITTAGSAS